MDVDISNSIFIVILATGKSLTAQSRAISLFDYRNHKKLYKIPVSISVLIVLL